MAYETPPQWIHGNVPTAALMNKYSDALKALKSRFDDTSMFLVAATAIDNSDWAFAHVHRYLWYKGSGYLTDVADRTQQVSLSDTDDKWERFDLGSVSWLYPGKLYEVTDVDGAIEMWR
jgi:hypothetical protein